MVLFFTFFMDFDRGNWFMRELTVSCGLRQAMAYLGLLLTLCLILPITCYMVWPMIYIEWLHITLSRPFLPIFMAAHQAGLKTQQTQRNLYTGRNRNSINRIVQHELIWDHSIWIILTYLAPLFSAHHSIYDKILDTLVSLKILNRITVKITQPNKERWLSKLCHVSLGSTQRRKY